MKKLTQSKKDRLIQRAEVIISKLIDLGQALSKEGISDSIGIQTATREVASIRDNINRQ